MYTLLLRQGSSVAPPDLAVSLTTLVTPSV